MTDGAIRHFAVPGKLAVVIIFMAIGADRPDLSETPLFSLLVAFGTRGCNMGSIENEFPLVVPVN
jgi:hypothetical protein